LRWNAPQQGLCKINVDAALSKTKIGGAVGVVCRDEQGVLLGASARVIEGINDPATLEAWACAEGLALAEDLNIKKLMLATDCLGVSQEIKYLNYPLAQLAFSFNLISSIPNPA
jgi:ribonuclease HI